MTREEKLCRQVLKAHLKLTNLAHILFTNIIGYIYLFLDNCGYYDA